MEGSNGNSPGPWDPQPPGSGSTGGPTGWHSGLLVGSVLLAVVGAVLIRTAPEYVADFTRIAAGPKFNPHVTIGVGTEVYLMAMLAEPFQEFTFSPIGASVYQLGSFGTARKKLATLNTTD